MGHEFVEMKNSHAAIEAYRKAVGMCLGVHIPLFTQLTSGITLYPIMVVRYVDVNRKDFRAWYGLGQAYELLSMHQYALYYYQHATALRFVHLFVDIVLLSAMISGLTLQNTV